MKAKAPTPTQPARTAFLRLLATRIIRDYLREIEAHRQDTAKEMRREAA